MKEILTTDFADKHTVTHPAIRDIRGQKVAIGKTTASAMPGTKKSDCVTNGADYRWRDRA